MATLNHTSSPLAADFILPEFQTVNWVGVLTGLCTALGGLWSLSTLWRTAVLVFILANLKNFPTIYHMRLVNAFRFVCASSRPKVELSSANIFQPIITTSRAPLMEIDLNLHKSNSTYLSDVDISRSHLLCTLFSKGVAHHRGGSSAVTFKKGPMFNLALGATCCTFRRELRPYEPYELWTRVLTWDKKWVYIVTHFVRKGAVQPTAYTLYPFQAAEQPKRRKEVDTVPLDRRSSADSDKSFRSTSSAGVDLYEPPRGLVATALSKCVFKVGRKTIPPTEMFALSGIMPADGPWPDTVPRDPSLISSCEKQWTWDMVEQERQRGMAAAKMLFTESQQNLEKEFTGEAEVLGKHRDGTGITGVVTTLASLAGLHSQQFL